MVPVLSVYYSLHFWEGACSAPNTRSDDVLLIVICAGHTLLITLKVLGACLYESYSAPKFNLSSTDSQRAITRRSFPDRFTGIADLVYGLWAYESEFKRSLSFCTLISAISRTTRPSYFRYCLRQSQASQPSYDFLQTRFRFVAVF